MEWRDPTQRAASAMLWLELVAGLARHAIREPRGDGELIRHAARAVRLGLDASDVSVGPVPAAKSHDSTTVVVPLPDSARSLVVTRPARGFAAPERAFVDAIAEVLASAGSRTAAAREHYGHDALTGLLDRDEFAKHVTDALGDGATEAVTVLVLDVDDFVLVNETLGPAAGDALLRGVAERLQSTVGDGVQLARIAGDEFAVLDVGATRELQAVELAQRIQAALRPPFELGVATHAVSASIGIAFCAAGGDPAGVIRDAHLAQRRAREHGRGRYEVFKSDLRAGLAHRRSLEQELRRAIEQHEFELLYLPVVETASGRIRGAEALLRWRHPERGLIGPAEFIDIAESSDLIVPIGAWALRQALRQLKAWETLPGHEGFRLGVNVSGRQLADGGFVDLLRSQLAKYRLRPDQVICELTETALTDESPPVEQAVAAIKTLGTQIALDDFGTGYASLRYVRRFNFDALKLDRSFIAGMHEDPQDAALVAAAVTMGRALGMRVVAEGVETTAQAERLCEMGCDFAQGFLYSRPLKAADLHAMVVAQADQASAALARDADPDARAGAGSAG